MSGQLAEIVRGLRSFIHRALSSCVRVFQENPTDRTEALPGICGASVCFTSPHGHQQTMRRFTDVQKVFAGVQNV